MAKGEGIYPAPTHKSISELNADISNIQKSTRATVPAMVPLHDTLRQKYHWYYDWHLNGYASKLHTIVFILYFLAISGLATFLIAGGKLHKAKATTQCLFDNNWGSGDGLWNNVDNWQDCGHIPTANDDVLIMDQDLIINTDTALAASFEVDGSFWGIITFNEGSSLTLDKSGGGTGNFTVAGWGGPAIIGNNAQITVEGNFSWIGGGTFNAGTSKFNIQGSSINIQDVEASIAFNDLTIDPGNGNTTTLQTNTNNYAHLLGDLTVSSGTLSIPGNFTLYASKPNPTVTIASGAVLGGAGKFQHFIDGSGGNGNLALSGTGKINVGTFEYYISNNGSNLSMNVAPFTYGDTTTTNLLLNANYTSASKTGTFNVGTPGTLAVKGNITLQGGSGNPTVNFSNPNNTDIQVGGNWGKSGPGPTFVYNKGTETVTFNGSSGTQTIDGNIGAFNNVTINNTGTSAQLTNALNVDGNFRLQAGTFDTNTKNQNFAKDFQLDVGTTYTKGGTLTFNGTSLQTITDETAAPGQDLGAVTIGPSTTTSVATANKMRATTLTIGADDALDITGDTLTIRGTVTPFTKSGTFTTTGSTVVYAGSTATNVTVAAYNNLTFTPESGTPTYGLAGNLTTANSAAMTGTLTINANAILDATATPYSIDLAGNWTNFGTFTANSSTVTLNGTGLQTLSGEMLTTNAFYNLTITNTSGSFTSCETAFSPGISFSDSATISNNYIISVAARVQYANAKTYTVTNINWNGGGTNMVFRNSNLTSGTWLLNVSGAQTDVTNVDVARSNATGSGAEIDASNGTNTDCHNNTKWNFVAGVTISGSIWTDEGKSAKVGNDKTVAVSINGAPIAATVKTTNDGDFEFTGLTVADDNPISVFLSGETEKASFVTQAIDNATPITFIDLYLDKVVLSHQTAGPMTNGILATAYTLIDPDLLFSVADSNVTFTKGINILASKTYTPGGDITIAGSWVNAGSFAADGYQVVFNAASGIQTLDSGGIGVNHKFNNFVKSNAGTLQLSGNDLEVDGTFDLTGGTFDAGGKNQFYAGNITLAGGTTYAKGGELRFEGSSQIFTDNTTAPGQDLGVGNIGPATTTSVSTANKMHVTTLTINADDTLNITDDTLTIAGTGTPFTKNGNFTINNSTVIYSGGDATNITVSPYNNLIFAPESGTPTYSLLGNLTGANDIDGNLEIASSATMDTTGGDFGIDIKGNWTNNGGFTANSSTVNFTGTASGKTVKSNDSPFYNLQVTGSGSWQLGTSNLTVTNATTISNGELTGGAGIMIFGDTANHNETALNITGGTFTAAAMVNMYGTFTRTDPGQAIWTNSTLIMDNLVAGAGEKNLPLNDSNHPYFSVQFKNSLPTYNGEYYQLSPGTTTVSEDLTIKDNILTLVVLGSNTLTIKDLYLDCVTSHSAYLVGGTMDPIVGGTINVSGDWNTSTCDNSEEGGFYPYQSTVIFDGSNNQLINRGKNGTNFQNGFYNLVINKDGGSLTNTQPPFTIPPTYFIVGNDFHIIDGSFVPWYPELKDVTIENGGSLGFLGDAGISGTFDNSHGGTFNMVGGNTTTFKGANAQEIKGANTWYNLVVNNTGGAGDDDVSTTAAQTVSNQLVVTDGQWYSHTGDIYRMVNIGANGTINPDAGATINVSGTWTNAGTFTHNNSTVIFNGTTNQIISVGGKNFYNITVSTNKSKYISFSDAMTIDGTLNVSAGRNLRFTKGLTYTFPNASFSSGSSYATLRSSGGSGSRYNFNLTSASTLDNVDVKDSNASGNTIICSSCTDSGNNNNWVFKPLTPTASGGEAISATAIKWKFTYSGPTVNSFHLYGASGSWSCDSNSCTETSLSPNTQYSDRRVFARNEAGDSGLSDPMSAWTLANTPLAPTCSAESTKIIKVIVNANGNPSGTNYVIANKDENQFLQTDGSWGGGEVWSEWGGSGGVTNNGLTENTSYTYKVKAKNSEGAPTGYSSTNSCTTGVPTEKPNPPTNLRAQNITATSIDLAWDAPKTGVAVAGYRLYNSQTNIQIAQTTDTNQSLTNLQPNTQYKIYIKSYDTAGNLSDSLSITIITLSSNTEITPQTAFLVLGNVPQEANAGQALGNKVKLMAADAGGAVITTYNKAVYFSSSDSAASFHWNQANPYVFTAIDAGVHEFGGQDFVFNTAGQQVLSATDGTIQSKIDIRVLSGSAVLQASQQAITSFLKGETPTVNKAVVSTTTALLLAPATVNLLLGLGNLIPQIFYWLIQLSQALGIRRRRAPWGVIFNSQTGQPISLALVRVYDKEYNRLLETAVTDKEGRFGFLVGKGNYYITVSKIGFIFPSQFKVSGYFDNIYTGGSIKVAKKEDRSINLNIPLDPQVKASATFNITTDLIKLSGYLSQARLPLLLIGTLFAIILAIRSSSLWYMPLLVFYFIILVLEFRNTKKARPYGLVSDVFGHPLDTTIVRIYNKKTNRLMATDVTDQEGRFKFLVDPGVYYLAATKPDYLDFKSHIMYLEKERTLVTTNIKLRKLDKPSR